MPLSSVIRAIVANLDPAQAERIISQLLPEANSLLGPEARDAALAGAIARSQRAQPRRLSDYRMGTLCLTHPSR